MVTRTGELVRLDLPGNPNFIMVVRTVVAGAITSTLPSLTERLDDIRLAVTEACNHVVRLGMINEVDHRVELCCFTSDDQLKIQVEALFEKPVLQDEFVEVRPLEADLAAEQSWSQELMGALVDELEIVDDEQRSAVVLTLDL